MPPDLKSWQTHLIKEALQARTRAQAPYSNFQVGAALLASHGKIITGANVESASYGLTCCAERIAIFKALTEGTTDFKAMAVVARCSRGPTPCGACRQILAEYAPKAVIWVADSSRPGKIREFTVTDLLPTPFL
jgi:cytidine deaminase